MEFLLYTNIYIIYEVAEEDYLFSQCGKVLNNKVAFKNHIEIKHLYKDKKKPKGLVDRDCSSSFANLIKLSHE